MGNRKLWLASIDGALHPKPLKHKNPATGHKDQVTQSATPEESVRLIRAFSSIPDPFVRKLLTEIAEKYARE
jgi:hypothetical protein